MQLKNLKLNNFQAYKQATFNLTAEHITFIMGLDQDTRSSNGAGKSSIKEAVLFALFGKAKVKMPDLIRRGQKNMSVELELEHLANTYKITRSKKGSLSTLILSVNGVEQSGTVEVLQKQIESCLGVTLDTFITYSIIDKVRDTDLTRLTSTDLRQVLQDLIGFSRIQKAYDIIAKKKAHAESYVKQVKVHFYPSQKRLATLNKSLATISGQQTLNANKILELNTALWTVESRTKELHNTIENLQQDIKSTLSTSTCPTCNAPIDISKRITMANNLSTQVTSLEQELKGLPLVSIDMIQSLKRANDMHSKRVQKLLYRKGQLSVAIQEASEVADTTEGIHKYAKALGLIQEYMTQALQSVALRLEDQMNAELNRFLNVSCKINLTRTTSVGTIIPTCTISLFKRGEEFDYSMLSSGEQALVSLIFKLVISNLRGGVDLLFIDEGLDALDGVNRERVLSMLELSPAKQLFIISHREDAGYLKAAQRINIRMVDGVSEVLTM